MQEEIKTEVQVDQIESVQVPEQVKPEDKRTAKQKLNDLIKEMNESEFVPTLSQKMELMKLQKQVRKQVRFQKYIQRYREKMELQSWANHQKMKNVFDNYKQKLTKKVFYDLADICTIKTPEVKNDKGEITQQANRQLNLGAFLIECRNMEALIREDRILNGKRKRTSGGRSNRKHHRSMVKFINNRSDEATLEIKE